MSLSRAQSNLIAAQQAYIAELQKMMLDGNCNHYDLHKASQCAELLETGILFSAYADQFMAGQKVSAKPSSYCNYQYMLQKHIIPYFGSYPLDKITAKDLQCYITLKAKLLSPKSVKEQVMLVKNILHCAERENIIAPKKYDVKLPKTPKEKYRVLTDDEYTRIHKHFLDCKSCPAAGVMIALETGARIGEVCALKWADVDFPCGTISVNKAVQRVYDCDTHTSTINIGTPKTQKSNRYLYPPYELLEWLKHRKQNDECYICTGTQTVYEPRTMRQFFERGLKRAGVEHIKFHALRHSFATRAISAGIDPKTVAELLGHENCDITLNIYTTCTDDMMRCAVEKLSSLSRAGLREPKRR